MSTGTDLSELYNLRHNFTIIALTGRTGSGCSTVAKKISRGFSKGGFPSPRNKEFDLKNNSYKKYDIVYRFAEKNFEKYTLITYEDVITLLLLKYSFSDLINYLNSEDIQLFAETQGLISLEGSGSELGEFKNIEIEFENFRNQFSIINANDIDDDKRPELFCSIFFSKGFKAFSDNLHKSYRDISLIKYSLLLTLLTYNFRRSGSPFSSEEKNNEEIFTIVRQINEIIKNIRHINNKANKPTKVVIDSLKNPFEVLYFKQRYAAFYLLAVNREDKKREELLQKYYGGDYEVTSNLLEQEYKGGKGKDFYKQYVRSCIEKADIHLNYRSLIDCKRLNEIRIKQFELTSPFFSWEMQLLKFISLIERPGIVTPSPEERCMQLAYTAKYNSGCISRQVGATITDENYSVKAIGWNNTPQGQVPCSLRNAEALLTAFDNLSPDELENTNDSELLAFTPYERTDKVFKKVLQDNFKTQINSNQNNLKGRNVCFCFKTLQNSCSEGKNQVHTRSLHAEESAFLQITKYGGTAIKGGKLFTSASPCELCAKKAYQLGIKVIYYVDPYPGISQKQILDTGTQKPEVRLFNGVIGNAYHWLYEPLMAYKDELALILDQDIADLTSIQKSTIKDQNLKIDAQDLEIAELKEKLRLLELKSNEQ